MIVFFINSLWSRILLVDTYLRESTLIIQVFLEQQLQGSFLLRRPELSRSQHGVLQRPVARPAGPFRNFWEDVPDNFLSLAGVVTEVFDHQLDGDFSLVALPA